jgi:hypothetical protein
MRKEIVALIELARIDFDRNRMERLVSEDFDYEFFLDQVEQHKLESMMMYHMESFKECTPIATYIKKNKKKLIDRMDFFDQEAKRVSIELNKLGIKNILFKGLSYIKNVYRHAYIRDFKDTDFLIDTKDIISVHRYLIENGFEVMDFQQDNSEEYLIELSKKREKLYSYYNKQTKFRLEVHHVFREEIYKKVFKKYHFQEDSVLYSNQIGIFLIACMGVYQHSNHLNHAIQYLRVYPHQLRRLTDVYESFNMLCHNHVQLLKEIVNEEYGKKLFCALCITKQIYGDMDLSVFHYSEYDFKYQSKYYMSDMIRRFFEPKQEYQKIIDCYNRYKIHETPLELKFSTYTKDIEFAPASTVKEGFWHSQLFYSSFIERPQYEMKYRIKLKKTSIIFDCDITSDNNVFSKKNEQYSNLIWIGLDNGQYKNSSGVLIILDECIDSIPYLATEASKQSIIKKIEEVKVNRENIQSHVHVIVEIPLHLFEINLQDKSYLLYEVGMQYTYDNEVEISYWNGGVGALFDNSARTYKKITVLQ